MRVNKNHTIDEIKALYKDAAPKFVALKTQSGQFVLHYNRPKLQDEKFKEIIDKLSKRSTTPGVYVVAFRPSTLPTSQEQEFPVVVGQLNEDQPQQIVTYAAPSESVWSMTKAMEVLSQKINLEIQLKYVEAENIKLQSMVDELEEELSELKKNSPLSESSNPLSFVKEIGETFRPIIDVYFEQRERELSLQEAKAGISRKGLAASNLNKERSDGGVMPMTNGYKEYFENILKSGDENALNHECDFLEANFPELYVETMKFYQITEEDETDEIENSDANAKAS